MANQTIDTDFVLMCASGTNKEYKIIYEENKAKILKSGLRSLFGLLFPKKEYDEQTNEELNRVGDDIRSKIANGQLVIENQIGFIINKELPKNKDIVYDAFIPACCGGFLCRAELKEIITQNNFTGCYFQSLWLKSYKSEHEPEYYIFTATNPVDCSKYEIEAPEDKLILKQEIKKDLQDFNYRYYPETGIFISPEIISQKVYQTLKHLKGVVFLPIYFQ